MNLDVMREVDRLKSMTVRELRARYLEVFGEASRSGNKDFLWKRIAWRVQSAAEGDLSERARRRAEEIVDESDLRVRAPSRSFKAIDESSQSRTASYYFPSNNDRRVPMPGAILSRNYKGSVIRVMVLEKGYEYNGEIYRSLTAIARLVTGARWNGFHFFGLLKDKEAA